MRSVRLLRTKPDPAKWTKDEALLFDLSVTAFDAVFPKVGLKVDLMNAEAAVLYPLKSDKL